MGLGTQLMKVRVAASVNVIEAVSFIVGSKCTEFEHCVHLCITKQKVRHFMSQIKIVPDTNMALCN